MLRIIRQLPGHHSSRADLHTFTAVDTGAGLHGRNLILSQAQKRRGGLRGRNIQIKNTKAHHRTAGNNLHGLLLKAAGFLHQLMVIGADPDFEILGPGNGVSRYRYNSVH